MATKTRLIFIIIILPAIAAVLSSQESSYFGEFYSILNDEGKFVFFQKFSWSAVDNILKYEVVVEKDSMGYKDYAHYFTEEEFIELSLPPGKYRYAVIPYGLLGKPGQRSEWKEFEVLMAYEPEITGFTPEVFYLDRKSDRIVSVYGKNLTDETEIYLVNENNIIRPLTQTVQTDALVLEFSDYELIIGRYNIYAINPGGLETLKSGFSIGYRKPLDLFFTVFWTPVIPWGGYINDIYSKNFYPRGFTADFSMISSKRASFNGGLELGFGWYGIGDVLPFRDYDMYSFNEFWLQVYTLDISFLLQKRFFHHLMALNFRFGIGIGNTVIADGNFYPVNSMAIQVNFGASYTWFFYKYLYVEAGCDYHYFIGDSISQILQPRLGIGVQF